MPQGYKHGGLKPIKYHITKNNGNPCDPDAMYFVLRVDADPHARVALAAYCQSVRADNPVLAADIAGLLQSANMKNDTP